MAEFPAVSPLLDGFTVGECFSSHDGVSCYDLRHEASGQCFVLKHISVPESEAKIQALLLSGAYTDKEAANEYFKRVADGYAEEFALSKSFSDCPYILHYLSHQVIARQDNAGYDVYAVADKAVPLRTYMAENAMTKLQAVNLGIDLCAALCAIREAGYLHQNIKPENIFLDRGRFLLGDLGMTALQDMKYSSLPEQYIGAYTAPELHDIMAEQNETTDLYAVGMLLYRIYNGDHAPYEDEHVTAKEADRMRLSGKELPAPMFADYELAEILLKACAFKKEDRYQTPQEMKQALEFYMQRNGTNDTLIVPPIVSDPEPEAEAEHMDDETAMPVRFADVSAMDEDFIRHFSPDTAALDAAIAQIRQDDGKEAAKQPEKEPIPEVFPDLPEPAEAPEPEAPEQDAADAEKEEAPEATQQEKEDAKPLVIKGIENIPDSTQEEEPPTEPKELVAPQEDLPKDDTFETPRAELTMIEDEQSDGSKTSSGRRRGHRHHRQKEEDAYGEKTQKKAAKRRKLRKILLSGLLLLLVASVFVYFFTPLGQKVYHYFINIESFEVSEVTADSVSVRIRTNVSDPPLTVYCTDSYGNRFDAPLTGNTATFTGLKSGTQYMVCAELREDVGPHRLNGTDRLAVSTLPSTEILGMDISAGDEEGVAVVSINVKPGDPEPSSWTLTYCCEGSTSQERSFRGTEHSFRITGLEVGKEYTFTLLSSDLANLIGETTAVFTPQKAVTAEGLKMSSFVDGELTVVWDCTSDAPEKWSVSCTAPDGWEQSIERTECKASFAGLQPGTPYTVKLTAQGLFVPLTVEIPENLLHIDEFTATEEDDGIHMAWSCPSASENGNWLLISAVSNDRDTMVSRNVEGSSAVVTDLVPDTTYSFLLRSAEDYTVVGHNLIKFETPKPEQFDIRGFSADNTVLKTFAVPEEEDWQAKDLEAEKTTFDAADQIVYKLLAPTGRYKGSFSLLYVLRDENGIPVSFGSDQFVWNEVWAWDNENDFSMAGTVDAPDRNGTYTLEIYFSLDTDGYIRYQSVAVSAPITVTGAPEE